MTGDGPRSISSVPRKPFTDDFATALEGRSRGAEAYDLARAISVLHGEHRQCSGPVYHTFPDDCPLFKAWEERRPR